MSELRNEILTIAESLRKDAKLENGKVVFADDAFLANAPEGLDKETFKSVTTYQQNFALAQGVVTGELAVPYFKENKEAKDVQSAVTMPVGKTTVVVQRENVTRNPSTGAETTHHAFVNARIAIKVPGSQTQLMRQRIFELAKKEGLGA